jgi:hypothetical protein
MELYKNKEEETGTFETIQAIQDGDMRNFKQSKRVTYTLIEKIVFLTHEA